jgi:hypothetical protein
MSKYIFITICLVLTSCCNSQPEKPKEPKYALGQQVKLKGFHALCSGVIKQFDKRDGNYLVVFDCPKLQDYVESWITESSIVGAADEQR